MHLTREEQRIIDGEMGDGARHAMEILVALGEVQNAERLIDVSSVQVSGVSYKTIGDAGLEFLEDWARKDVRTKVFSTLNPAGMDLELGRSLGCPEGFIKKQMRIIEAYKKMGVKASCTCTPYLAGNRPAPGAHIAWAESSSVIYANSVLGARSNRESGVSALASALIGKTPYCGLHLDENRGGTFVVDVDTELKDKRDYAALGYYLGRHYDGIPVFRNIRPSDDEMKIMGAALATGPISMFYVEGVTPGMETVDTRDIEKVAFTTDEMKEACGGLNTCGGEPDVICIGCPHLSPAEIKEVVKLNPKKEVWLFTARENKIPVKNKNIKIISDTCMVVSPLKEMGIESVGVNSAKAAFYCSNLSGLDVKFDSIKGLLEGGG
jgi:phosphomecalonate degydratase large subunit